MKKFILSMLLPACLLVSLALLYGMRASAEATEVTDSASRVTWSGGEYVVKSSVSIAGLDITGNVTLTISSGCMLTVTGANGVDCIATSWIYPSAGAAGINISSGATLTLKGSGTLSATGGNGGRGWSGNNPTWFGEKGGDGIVSSGTLSVGGRPLLLKAEKAATEDLDIMEAARFKSEASGATEATVYPVR